MLVGRNRNDRADRARSRTRAGTSVADELRQLLGNDAVADDAETFAHSGDKWFAAHPPEVVVFARSTSDVSKLLQFASRKKIPVTARGGGYGYVGGCVPVRGGIALSLARMNRIKEISFADAIAIVEPGVITADLKAAVRAQKLFYPPDPASMKDCTIGGNVATNAGGPRCLKYGSDAQLCDRSRSRARERRDSCEPADGCTKTRPASI